LKKRKALVIIDMIVRDVAKRVDKARLIKNQLRLMKAFLDAGEYVILAGGNKTGIPPKTKNPVMMRLWGDEHSANPAENKIVPELLRARHSFYINKPEYSAFFHTNLEQICRKHRIGEIYFCGIYSGVCVLFSAADAAMRKIQPFLVSDASGSVNLEAHKKNIQRFSEILGPTLTTNELISLLKKR